MIFGQFWRALFLKPHSVKAGAASAPASERLDYLDSIRGVAALAVIGWHYFEAYNMPPGCHWWITKPLITLFYDGGAAVSIFFVLSGFVLTLKPSLLYGDQYSLRGEIAPFIITRGARILLPYWAVLLLSHFVGRYFYSMPSTIPQANPWLLGLWQGPAAQNIGSQFMFAQTSYLPQGWTLSVEWVCSLLLPFMILVANDGIVCLAIFVTLYVEYFGANMLWIISFAIGLSMAVRLDDLKRRLAPLPFKAKVALFVAGLVILDTNTTARYIGMISVSTKAQIMANIAMITTVGAALVILSVLISSRLQQILRQRVLLFYGRMSYSVYLLHIIVLVVITPKILHFLNLHGIRNITLANICGYVSTILFTTLFAAISYEIIEKPSIRLGRLIVNGCRTLLLH